ncbi:unnamed protein product [Ixodes hexagonus]
MTALDMATSLAIVLLCAGVCAGHPDGADDEACKDMYPSHGYRAKSASEGYAEGYRLVQEKEDYKPGDIITVTLFTVGSPFKGFLIKAFDEDENDAGSFKSTGPDSRAYSHCSGITHTWRNLKKKVVVQWLAPENKSGKVHFKATVAKTIKDVYHALPSTVA